MESISNPGFLRVKFKKVEKLLSSKLLEEFQYFFRKYIRLQYSHSYQLN